MKENIQITNETKKQIRNFGLPDESYDEILKRIYSLAVKEQLRQFYESSKTCLTIDEARKLLNKKYPA